MQILYDDPTISVTLSIPKSKFAKKKKCNQIIRMYNNITKMYAGYIVLPDAATDFYVSEEE